MFTNLGLQQKREFFYSSVYHIVELKSEKQVDWTKNFKVKMFLLLFDQSSLKSNSIHVTFKLLNNKINVFVILILISIKLLDSFVITYMDFSSAFGTVKHLKYIEKN